MFAVQEFIHKIEEGNASHWVRIFLVYLLLVAVGVGYDLRAYRNFSTEEAMDAAQIARNLGQGRGFSTDYIRPLSLDLVWQKTGSPKIKENHPDLANAPLYPLALAAVLKVAPVEYEIQNTKEVPFKTYGPEIAILVFNQMLLVIVILLTFFLARNLFDSTVAWLSACLVAGTELLWRFSASGLSTILLVVLLLVLISILVRVERLVLGETPATRAQMLKWGALIGLTLGVLTLTRYSLGWLVIPLLAYAIFSYRQHRWNISVPMLTVFFLVLTPWLIRNYQASGHMFGIAGFAVIQETADYPGNTLERSLWLGARKAPGITDASGYLTKFAMGMRDAMQNEIPKFTGSWVAAFFLVSLFIPFSNPVLIRVRRLLISIFVTFLFVQVLGKTHLSSDSMTINSENLLVLLTPMVLIFGAAVFSILLEQLELPFPPFKYAIYLALTCVCSIPLFLQMLPPKSPAAAYPPYYPPVVQMFDKWIKPNELVMSDVPWAVAWYSNRKCVHLTQNPSEPFIKMNDEIQTVNAIYLTQVTLDSRMVSEVFNKRNSWSPFGLMLLTKGEVPNQFPLKKLWSDMYPDQLVLMDWDRWKLGKKISKNN